MARKPYPSDVTDRQWQLIQPHIPPEKPGGRHREVDMREVINAMFYLDRTGCQWRLLPHEFPPWRTVYEYKRQFQDDGTWRRMHDALREQVRVKADKQKTPSAAIIDSQSVKTAEKGGRVATTRARRSTAASGTSPWTPWG